ncbi:MAG: alpha/beta fold hydrolase [Acidimicrobiales bacterium]
MTTVDESVQPAPPPLSDPDRAGVLRTAAGTIAWAAVGRIGAPAALLLPGADDLLGWPPAFVAALVAQGLQVVAITVPAMVADDALAVADAAAAGLLAAGVSRAHVLGASQGGIAAQALAAAHPARVASLTLLMTRRPTAAPLEVPSDLLAVLAPARGGGPLLDRAVAAATAVAPGAVGDRSALDARVAAATTAGSDPVTALLSFAAGEDPTVPPLPVAVPATVVHGRGDPVVPIAAAERLAAGLGAELVVVPGGHDLPWGREAEVARRVADLAAAEGGPARPSALRAFSTRLGWGRRPGKLSTSLSALFLLAMVAIIAGSTIDVPYYAIRPGSARQTNDLVEVPRDRRFLPKGQLLFVTVGVGRLKALGWLLASRDHDVEIVPERDILGTTPKDQYREQVTQEMVDAKQAAVVVALSRLCENVAETGTGARVDKVVDGSPAAAAGLTRGDTVTALDGAPVATSDEALAALKAKPPGATLSLTVAGPAESTPARTATVTLGSRPEDPTRSFLGVTLRTRQQSFSLPFEVAIDSGRVGGPSAGLEFALSVVDQLTPGEMTGGGKVAVTGTIELDGTVGAVGGIPQKTVTVRRAGAKLFLVPKEQVAEAQAKAGSGLEIVGVSTLEEAIGALAARGGDISGIPGTCPGR